MKIIDILFDENLSDDNKIDLIENTLQIDFNDITEDLLDQVRQEFKIWRSSRIKSSNVKRMSYNDETRILTVQFNDKSIYTYYDISFDTYMKLNNGEYSPRTSGSNKYGSWKKGVRPSTGAGIWQALIDTGVRYERGGSFK